MEGYFKRIRRVFVFALFIFSIHLIPLEAGVCSWLLSRSIGVRGHELSHLLNKISKQHPEIQAKVVLFLEEGGRLRLPVLPFDPWTIVLRDRLRTEQPKERKLLGQIISRSHKVSFLKVQSLGFLSPARFIQAKAEELKLRRALIGMPLLQESTARKQATWRWGILTAGAVWVLTATGIQIYETEAPKLEQARLMEIAGNESEERTKRMEDASAKIAAAQKLLEEKAARLGK